jgi:hypothetical protein
VTTLAPPAPPDADLRVQRLREPLLAELRPSRRRVVSPRSLRAFAAVALAVAFAVIAITATRDPAPALAVEHEDGWVVLRVADASAGAAALTRELREAGIRGEVRLLPVAPDEVGLWVVISEHGISDPLTPAQMAAGETRPPETVRLSHVRNDGETLRIPIADVRDSSGRFIFYVGREAQPGEELLRDGPRSYAPKP